MARGRKPRTWVKMDCEGILRGSINYLLPLEGQAVWMKMVALSEVCGGRPGYIEDNNQNGLPSEYVSQELHCPIELLKTVLKIMESDGAIKLNGTGSIQLVNFKHYQFSEYDRQKPYREKIKAKNKEEDFNKFIEEKKKEFPNLDIEKELKKFELYWSEGNRNLQRPKLAFQNWLDKAMEFKKDGKNRGSNQRARPLPTSYTNPEDL